MKRAMTLTLTEAEMKLLDDLSEKKDATKTAIIRQAIRLYHLVDSKLAGGSKLFIGESETGAKSELMML
jgi:predicted transcriptional regulator